ncbi:alpha/beta fold hydrolase [Roseovarius rhodophyticola]|uniref:Alpha/beta fold hydrolase n=1 Tax=Roseovarius rhodophyticola TaxID=3080827 RepID=A0ABZ2TAT9_9RHOB|nr:alpha/beta fold hydrolase [Roseovarius sp. W115]MDV2930520.1 alpha/beta fold hydrolase [Roseovarius sp. W115]
MYELSGSVALNYRDEGEGAPVLFVHGVGADLESWDGVLRNLCPGRRYLRYDQRGHGQSRRTPGPYTLQDLSGDAVALLDHLGVECVSVVGFSLGGLVAQAIALDHPERVQCLTLISTVAGRTPQEQIRVNERAETLAREGATRHLANAVDRWFTPEFVVAHPEVLEARRQKSLQNDPECYVAAYRVLAGSDLGDHLYRVTAPTLIMTGENDIGSNPRMSEFIHSQIAGSQLHILPRLKHSVLLEAPEQIAALIDPFLAEHCGA